MCGVWKYNHWPFHGIRSLHLMCKQGLHEQLLKEEMETPVLGMLGIWLSVEVSSGHPQAPRLCCPQTHPKMNDFSPLVLIHLPGKTWPLPNPFQVCDAGSVARLEFSSICKWSLLPTHCWPQPSWPGHGAVVVCLLLNLAVVKGKSASWVELMDAREGLISICFWQPAPVLMLSMAH